MHHRQWRSLLIIPVFLCSILFCSGRDDSTGLGSDVIEEVYPGQVTIGKHIRQYSMDISSYDSAFSLPGASDTGFGVHATTSSHMIIGTNSDPISTERAAGYVQFICAPDSGKSRVYASNDTVRKIVIRFSRDSAVAPVADRNVSVWFSHFRSNALNPSGNDSLLGTVMLRKDSLSIPDSIVLAPGSLTDTIFKECTTTVKDSSFLKSRPVIGFIVTSLTPTDPLVSLSGNPQLTVKYTRGSDTAVRSQTYGSANTSYYLATDGNPDSLHRIPELSYASKRTAVFRYNAAALWDTVNNMTNQQHAQIVSAVFSLKGPTTGDTLNLRYLLLDKLERNGDALDSLFAVAPANQSVATVRDTSRVLANVLTSLQNFTQNGRPSTFFLYLRFNEDSNQKWKKTKWQNVPLLSAMIAVP